MAGAPDLRRQVGSPRPKGRVDRDTPCKNILIYGKCRYENAGCSFNHDDPRNSHASSSSENAKKALNGDSPSFTPSSLTAQPAKKSSLPSQAASAAVFTPRGIGAATPSNNPEPERLFNPAAIKEFTPQNNYDLASATAAAVTPDAAIASYDPFSTPIAPAQYNPYANDHATLGGSSATAYYQGQAGYATPLQPPPYHLYANIGPYREDLLPYQRQTRDFFMPDDLREDLQRKSHAALQVIPSTIQLENFHSLVPLDKLDTPHRKNTSIFGWTSWLFKAFSAKTGRIYCLRRIQDYRLGDREATQAIETIKKWKQINNANVVFIHDAFTTSAFGDRSLVFAQDYFPLAQTLTEVHLTAQPQKDHRFRGPATPPKIPESVIWSYVVQIANALRAIHARDLSARCLDPSKIILTEKNRIRLTACAILDVVQYQGHRSTKEHQQDDFVQLGKLILCLGAGKLPSQLIDVNAEMATIARKYPSGPKGESALRDLVGWLLTPGEKLADQLITGMPHHVIDNLDKNLQHTDTLTSELQRELENGRLVRLLMKMGMVNERQEFDSDPGWSENGERYTLKLFRDYVFHRVDEAGRPVFDMGHMVSCLNKLDAGAAERVRLTSRSGETDFIITYAELKKQLNGAFGDLMKHSRRA
ncbi:hypothetical protein diail_6528 [Diaporthe ilicicola]|nr:hypothetical protein diail_6528 [Diaporthe ilicicola]